MASTEFAVYVPTRALSGLYTTSLTATKRPKDWRPHINVPLGYVDGKPVMVDPAWFRHFRDLGVRKLGGANYPTLPDVANFVTQAQVDTQLAAAQDQMATANAQAIAHVIEILIANGLTTTSEAPPVVLARQETNPTNLAAAPFVEGGGGSGD